MCTIMEEVKAEGKAEGKVEGRTELAETIKELKNGVSKDELLSKGISSETITLAEELLQF